MTNCKKMLGMSPKRVGILICFGFIILGLGFSYLSPLTKSSTTPYIEELKEIITKLKGPNTVESLKCNIIELVNLEQINNKEIDEEIQKLSKFFKKREVSKNIKKVEELIGVIKKCVLTNIFFEHVLALIFIMSGIIGLFWILNWVVKEGKEKMEREEKQAIRAAQEQ